MLGASLAGFIANAVGVAFSIGLYGGLTKLASIPHFIALGYSAAFAIGELISLTFFESPLAWISAFAALSYFIPVLIGDIFELHQVFIQKRYFVLMPDGVVHPLKTRWEPDTSVSLDMTVMYKAAI